MKKQVVTKKMVLKEAGVYKRIAFGIPFFLVSIFAVLSFIQSYDDPSKNTVKNMAFNYGLAIAVFIVFGCLIGLRNIVLSCKKINRINSSDFIVEKDKVIDKIVLDSSVDNTSYCDIIFTHNRCKIGYQASKKIKIGEEFYIFNIDKETTIIKSVNKFELDKELEDLLSFTYGNEKNEVEQFEEE